MSLGVYVVTRGTGHAFTVHILLSKYNSKENGSEQGNTVDFNAWTEICHTIMNVQVIICGDVVGSFLHWKEIGLISIKI